MGEGKELRRPDALREGMVDHLFASIGIKMMDEFGTELGGVRAGGKRE
jgi:hypothetical protein